MPKISNRSTARKARRTKRSSSIYRVRNWAAYDQALKQRGSVTLWFSTDAVQAWRYQGPAQRGAQFVYSDVAIETALTAPSQEYPIEPIIALRKDAKIQQHGNRNAPPLARDEILRSIRKKGRKGWKHQSGYHRRSLAETQMFRYKQIIGDKRRARKTGNQQVESRLVG